LNTNYSVWDDYGTDQYLMNQTKLGLGYDKTFGLHTISAVVNYLWFSNKVDVNQNGWAGTSMNYNYENLGGTIHYDFNKKYLADFGFAESGSDNYAKGNQWGFYPALSAAWLISNESFLINNKTIDQLKLRASAGKTGNDQFWGDRYLYQRYFGSVGSYNTGTTSITNHGGTAQINTPNPDFFAEQSLKYNVGIDIKLFKKLQVTVEAFMDKRSGIVTQDNTLMATFGGASPYNNVGKVTNQGTELSAIFNDNIGKFSYFVNGMVTYSQNIIDYMAEVQPISGMRQTGNSINAKYGNQSIGFYQVDDFNADGTLKSTLPTPAFGAVQPGDLKYKDINGDGKINELDVAKIGLPYLPSTYYSFSCGMEYQGIDLQVLFQGAAGRDVNLLDDYNQIIAFNNNGNAFSIAKGAWAYYPDQNIDTRSTATYPRLSLTNNQNNYRTSDFWIKNGDFLRLRNLELGYSLPESVIKQIHFTKVRFFANTTNPFTWSSLLTNYHIDPETMTGVPALKTTTVGITLNF
jgi:TonB-linked SusC/RagA family outer membrane protein